MYASTMKTHERQSAAVLSIGDEITFGQTLDTNAQWIAARLTALGAPVARHVTVADDAAAIRDEILRLAESASIIISTGGLGPTADDLTRQALADAMGDQLIEDAELIEQISAHFAQLGRTLVESNRSQALRPSRADGIVNSAGAAPGLHAALTGADGETSARIWCLPGPPSEMRPMFEQAVAPALPANGAIAVRLLRVFGLGESTIAERLGDLMDRRRRPLVGTTASAGVVTVRIRSEDPSAQDALEETERLVRAALGDYIFGEGDATLPEAAVHALIERNETLTVVESCTGGLLGSLITEIPGASSAFLGGWITYANAMKSGEVSVPPAMLLQHGAVSEPVARAMAEGALASSSEGLADHALAITGVAGPGGGSEHKPVGTVFIARASRRERAGVAGFETSVERFQFPGDRAGVRIRSALTALAILRNHLIGADVPDLLGRRPND